MACPPPLAAREHVSPRQLCSCGVLPGCQQIQREHGEKATGPGVARGLGESSRDDPLSSERAQLGRAGLKGPHTL